MKVVNLVLSLPSPTHTLFHTLCLRFDYYHIMLTSYGHCFLLDTSSSACSVATQQIYNE